MVRIGGRDNRRRPAIDSEMNGSLVVLRKTVKNQSLGPFSSRERTLALPQTR